MNKSLINVVIAVSMSVLIVGCGLKEPPYDACGQINATEVIVSAESNGRVVSLTDSDKSLTIL